VGGASLRESPRSNSLTYAYGEVGLRETFLRIRQTDIGENVSAPLLDWNFFAHNGYSFWASSHLACSSSARLRRDLISSISALGVLMPAFDFFWNTCKT